MSFEPIRKILPQAVAAHGLTNQVRVRKVLELTVTVLQRLWGEERAAYITTVSFQEGTLKVSSTSAVAKQQLSIDQTRVINEINRALGERVVIRLEIRANGF